MKSSNISWRHHYLPEFYLNGFTDSDGTFKIYDIESQNFIKNGKNFSPKSYFFEKDSNTIFTEKGADDFIESKFYSKSDDRLADLFYRIRNAEPNSNFGVSDKDMPELQFFISNLYWRLPNNYNQIKHLIKTSDLKEFGIHINSDDKKKIEEIELKLRNDENFFKALKYYLPLITFPRIFNCRTPLTIQSVHENFPSICSDNPIIFKNSIFPDIYQDDFIFPLSKHLLFLRSNKINRVENTIKFDIDLILLKQAKKYVCCTDLRYIPLLNKYFMDNYKSVSELKESVLKRLFY